MNTVLARRLIAVASVGAFALIGTACMPSFTLQPPTGGATGCPEGTTWTLSSDTITSALSTLLGSATVTGSGGITLALTSGSPDTWTLGGSQTLHIVGTGFDVTATVSPMASGTNTQTGTTGSGGTGSLTFTSATLSGTASVTGTVNGQPISFTWPLGHSDDIDTLYGLNATANYTCNSNGTLSLSLPKEQMEFNQ